MRFVSPHTGYKHAVTKETWDLLASGQRRTLTQGFMAEFRADDYTEHERNVCVSTFKSALERGRKVQGNLGDPIMFPVAHDQRIGTFDTSTIEDENLREKTEKVLLESLSYGHDFIVVEPPQIPKPWARYDQLKAGGRGRTNETVADEICRVALEIGADPRKVIEYEQANANRPEVIQALESLSDTEPQEIVVEA